MAAVARVALADALGEGVRDPVIQSGQRSVLYQ
jgi:hypothetical protein